MAGMTRPGSGCDVCGVEAAGNRFWWRSYCGAECQHKDWKELGHKRVCKTIGAVRNGKAYVEDLIEADRVEEVRGLVLSGTVGVNDT